MKGLSAKGGGKHEKVQPKWQNDTIKSNIGDDLYNYDTKLRSKEIEVESYKGR